MRLILLGGLLLAALAVGLLVMIERESSPVTSTTPPETSSPRPADPIAKPAEPAPVVVAEQSRAPITTPVHRAAPALAPTLAPEPVVAAEPKRAKKIDTPTDILRWALMRAIRTTEPAVVDCLDQAKKAGTSVDGLSSYDFYLVKKGDQIVFDGSAIEAADYPASLSTCIQNAANGVTIDAFPEGANRVQVVRRLTVEHGDISAYKLGAFHIVDPANWPAN